MDPTATIAGAAIMGLCAVIAAAFAWHASLSNAHDTGYETARETARRETDEERRELLWLRDERLREYAEQIGAERLATANALAQRDELRSECAALEAENQQLRSNITRHHGGLS